MFLRLPWHLGSEHSYPEGFLRNLPEELLAYLCYRNFGFGRGPIAPIGRIAQTEFLVDVYRCT